MALFGKDQDRAVRTEPQAQATPPAAPPKREHVMTARPGAGATLTPPDHWIGQAEKKLREAQAAYEGEKIRQELLRDVTFLNHDKLVRLKERVDEM